MRTWVALVSLVVAIVAGSQPAASVETYQLLFREGVLARLGDNVTLTYTSKRHGRSAPERPGDQAAATLQSDYELDLTMEAGGDAVLTVVQGKSRQRAGSFPRSVGNPLIMYFLETVLRDMANQAGGSPFYIRNRIKDSLLREADVRSVDLNLGDRTVLAQEVTIHPFAEDAARERMSGFGDLALVATVSEEVPGWYYSLSASAPAAPGENGPGYSNIITFQSQVPK